MVADESFSPMIPLTSKSVKRGATPSHLTDARKRRLVRLDGAKPPTARAAMALAKSQTYQDAADASATLRACAADLANYKAWCAKHGFEPMPATQKGAARVDRDPSRDWTPKHSTPFPPRHCGALAAYQA